MTTQIIQPHISYFGKIPTHADFVKSRSNLSLITLLDQWASKTIELMAIDPRWKITYDAIPPLHFAFLGSHQPLAIAGHLIASQDASARRFPFLAITMFDLKKPLNFMRVSPLAMSTLWSKLATHLHTLPTTSDPGKALLDLEALPINIDISGNHHTGFNAFIELQTIHGVEQLLAQEGHTANLRNIVLALGMLLQPVMQGGVTHLEKVLALPLPRDPIYRSLLASFWLTLISPFLAKTDVELSIFLGQIDEKQRLVLGFNGASPHTFHSVITPDVFKEHVIVLSEEAWVEEDIEGNYHIQKLASYLEQPDLSLRIAIATFNEVFIGEK